MSQPAYQPLDPDIIETLKAARDQVIQANKGPLRSRPLQLGDEASESEVSGKNMVGGPNPSSKRAPHQISTAIANPLKAKDKFAEEFVRKLSVIEQETTAIDEEMAKVEKLWSSLTEKKKQLENKRDELIKVKDKLKELDKDMSDILSKEL